MDKFCRTCLKASLRCSSFIFKDSLAQYKTEMYENIVFIYFEDSNLQETAIELKAKIKQTTKSTN